MKEIQRLQRRVHWSECVHLGLMTLVLASAITFTFQADDLRTQFLLILGAVLPVQLIRFLCERLERRLPRLLASLAVTALAVALTWENQRWSVCLICCLPILISGVFLPRSRGRILLTVPSLYMIVPLLFAYAYGRAVESLGVPMITNVVLTVTALATLNYFVYVSQCRLLLDFRMSSGAEVSVSNMIRQNRKTLAVFLVIGVVILTALPFLLRMETPAYVPLDAEEDTGSLISTDHYEEPADKEYRASKGGTPLDLELAKDILVWILVLIPGLGVIVSVIKGIQIMLGNVRQRKNSRPAARTDGLTVERLEEDRMGRKREKLTGYEKKLRRRYAKLIQSRVRRETPLAALTPTELERTAGLADRPETAEVHELYARTRYSPEAPDRETYLRFKELAKTLEHPE